MTKRIALVVGGTSGIGLASAQLLADRGAEVHVTGRDQDRLNAAVAAHPGLIGHRADGASQTEMATVLVEIGALDWLILSLGGSGGPGAFADSDLADVQDAFSSKFVAHLACAQAALPYLTTDASITFLTAVSARAGVPGTMGLAAVNGAIESAVRPLAVELAPVRVNAVAPGVVDTPWWNAVPPELKAGYFATVEKVLPTRQVARAADIADAVVFAATNPTVTGTVLEADGGARLVSLS